MLDQKAFNGVGNYLRSSIIKMMDINPFLKFGELSEEEIDALGKTTKLACEYFYMTKGGQLRDWKNPFGESGDFRSLLYYQQGESLYDKGKRRFWFDPKWKATEKYKEYVKQ
jgi:formamidopyrimidine-DNA glycosylase